MQLECGGFNYLRRVVLTVVEDGKAAATQARVYSENAPTELLAKPHASSPVLFGLLPPLAMCAAQSLRVDLLPMC